MDHFRLRKYRGPEVWERVREAYVAGEAAPQVARRFDVGLANLRKKASREGWTRAAAARGSDPLILATQPRSLGEPYLPLEPTEPAAALSDAVHRAAALIAAGRGAEATTLLKAAEALGRMNAAAVPAEPAPPTAEDRAQQEARQQAINEAVDAEVQKRANDLALALLTDTGPPEADYGAFALNWRARLLGPEVALADFARALDQGWADRHWDADGRLIPLDPAPPMPELIMIRQHLRRCQRAPWGQEDLSGWVWPPRDWWPEGHRPADGPAGDDAAGPEAEGPVAEGPRVRML
jgi:hypothetical protein